MPRQEGLQPGTPEGDEIGLSARQQGGESPIRGGRNHITNAQTVPQPVPVPDAEPEHGGILAHGVTPDTHTFRERADMVRGPNEPKPVVPVYRKIPDAPIPVPVYVVEPGQGARPLHTVATDRYTVPPAGTAAIRIAGRDATRSRILLLVETAAGAAGAAPTGIRFDHEVGNLDVGQGALLRAGAVSYLKLECNDELFAVSNDGSACTLSVIYLYGVPGAA